MEIGADRIGYKQNMKNKCKTVSAFVILVKQTQCGICRQIENNKKHLHKSHSC